MATAHGWAAILALMLTIAVSGMAQDVDSSKQVIPTSKKSPLSIGVLVGIGTGTGELGNQSNVGVGLQALVLREFSSSPGGSSIGVGIQAGLMSLGPNETDLSTFAIITALPSITTFLPSTSSARPFVRGSLGVGVISRTDDNRVNAVDYKFSEVSAAAAIAGGTRLRTKSLQLIAEAGYTHIASKLMGGVGILGIAIGVEF